MLRLWEVKNPVLSGVLSAATSADAAEVAEEEAFRSPATYGWPSQLGVTKTISNLLNYGGLSKALRNNRLCFSR